MVPTYRRPRLLAVALESVRAQAVPGVRVRVHDNASGDETAEVVRRFAARHPVEYVCHPENVGIAKNFAAALAAVDTRFCVFLSDDDLQLPGFLAAALDALAAHPTARAYCAPTLIYGSDARRVWRVQGASWRPGLYRAGEATRAMLREHFTWIGVVFETDVLRRLPLNDADMETVAALAERHDFVVGARPAALWRIHPRSFSADHSLADDRRVALNRLEAYLQLETLSVDDRLDVLLETAHSLWQGAFQLLLRAALDGGGAADVRRELRRAALLYRASLAERSARSGGFLASVPERFRAAAVELLVSMGSGPISPVERSALLGAGRLAGLLRRAFSREPPAPPSELEAAALAYLAELERAAAPLIA